MSHKPDAASRAYFRGTIYITRWATMDDHDVRNPWLAVCYHPGCRDDVARWLRPNMVRPSHSAAILWAEQHARDTHTHHEPAQPSTALTDPTNPIYTRRNQ